MADSGQDRRERLFVGAPISQGVRTALASALPTVLPGKVIDSDKWHFTLRFLGSTTAAARAQVIQYLKTVACGAPFQIRFAELGAFPNAGRARILWVGIDEGAERMIQLAAISEAAARIAGFAAETRPFKPHLTLSRIDPPQPVKTLLASKPRFGMRMLVESVILYRSVLGRGPARYEEVEHFALSAP